VTLELPLLKAEFKALTKFDVLLLEGVVVLFVVLTVGTVVDPVAVELPALVVEAVELLVLAPVAVVQGVVVLLLEEAVVLEHEVVGLLVEATVVLPLLGLTLVAEVVAVDVWVPLVVLLVVLEVDVVLVLLVLLAEEEDPASLFTHPDIEIDSTSMKGSGFLVQSGFPDQEPLLTQGPNLNRRSSVKRLTPVLSKVTDHTFLLS